MNKIAALLMAGSGTRMKMNTNKVLSLVGFTPLYYYSLHTLDSLNLDEILLIVKETELEEVNNNIEGLNLKTPTKIIIGGTTRAKSVQNAVLYAKENKADLLLLHDAARPLVKKEDIDRLIQAMNEYHVGTLCRDEVNTVRYIDDNNVKTLDRSKIVEISTPQAFKSVLFDTILNNEKEITDEVMLFEQNEKIAFIKETSHNLKVTTKDDLDYVEYVLTKKTAPQIGHSLDYHPFTNKRSLILSGVKFLDHCGLDGHSDADVVYHVVAESLMGAASLGDLGTLFPDTDKAYKDIDSSILVQEVMKLLDQKGYEVMNIDVMVYLLHPHLKNVKRQMAKNIENLTGARFVTVKAATLNKHGLIALEEGIGAEAVCLITKK